jgi:transporter family-2 protein
MKYFIYLLPFIAGISMSVQSGINGQLRSAVGAPLVAAFFSFLGGTLTLLVLLFLSRSYFPDLHQLSGIAWYKYMGGPLGVIVVTFVILSVHRVGASQMFVLLIAGQLITALWMDRYGLLGLAPTPVSLPKLAGIVLVIAGAYLVTKK